MALDPQLEQAFRQAQTDVRANGLNADLRSVILTGLAYVREGQDSMLEQMSSYYSTLHLQLNKMETRAKPKRVRDAAGAGAAGALFMGALVALAEWAKKTWGS